MDSGQPRLAKMLATSLNTFTRGLFTYLLLVVALEMTHYNTTIGHFPMISTGRSADHHRLLSQTQLRSPVAYNPCASIQALLAEFKCSTWCAAQFSYSQADSLDIILGTRFWTRVNMRETCEQYKAGAKSCTRWQVW